jgi:hypothetical protein
MCFAESGVMLYEEITSDSGTIKVEANEYSEDVSSSDFEPPDDVTELPGGSVSFSIEDCRQARGRRRSEIQA